MREKNEKGLEASGNEAELKSQIAKLEEKLRGWEEREKEASDWLNRKSELEREVEKMNEEKEKCMGELNEKRSELEREINGLKEEKEKSLSELNEKKGELEREINRLNEEKEKTESELNEKKCELEREIESLNEEKEKAVNELNEQKSELENEIAAMNEEKEKSLNALEANKLEIENEIRSLNEEKEKSLNDLTVRKNELETEIELLNEEKGKVMNELNAKKSELESEIKSVNENREKESNDLLNRKSELESEIEALNEEKEKRMNELNARMDEIENEIDSLNEEKEKSMSELNERKSEIQSEIEARLDEITRVALNAEFNGIKLMAYQSDGVPSGVGITSAGINLQVGLYAEENSVINLDVDLFRSATVSGLFSKIAKAGTTSDSTTPATLDEMIKQASNGKYNSLEAAVTADETDNLLNKVFAAACSSLVYDADSGEYTLASDSDTHFGAKEMLGFLDAAIDDISSRVTRIGAAQNRVESAITALDVQSQNLTSSLSTLRDTDVAEESSNYIQAQILQQASATLLATANQTPSIALNLV